MKRILAGILAWWMFFVPVAEARVAIIIDRDLNTYGSTTQTRADAMIAQQTQTQIAKSFIEFYNPGSVDVYTADEARTQLVKSGLVRGKQYAAIIWNPIGSLSATNNAYHVGCSACSLTIITSAANNATPTVPQLFLGSGYESETGGLVCAAACSTGSAGNSGYDPGTQGPDYPVARVHIVGSAKSWPATQGYSSAPYAPDYSTPSGAGSGTFRVLLGTDDSNSGDVFPGSAWRDSLYGPANGIAKFGSQITQATSPTYGMNVWVRYNTTTPALTGGPPGAAPNIFCISTAGHVQPLTGGDTGPPDARVQIMPTPIYIAIAWLDSLLGGAVLGSNIEPAKLAVQISGGFRRGGKDSPGGFPPFDSVYVGRSCDSTKTLGIPITVGVDPDSIPTYPSDKALWKRAGAVRWAMESWHGLADTTALEASANAFTGLVNPKIIDPFGRYRSRSWVRPTTDTTDTSVASMLAAGRRLIMQRLGVGSADVDGIVMAAGDDYLPRNWNLGGMDSLAVAVRVAGFTGISMNAEDSLSKAQGANRWHDYPTQRFQNGAAFLAFPGYNSRGALTGNAPMASGGAAPSLGDSNYAVHHSIRSMFGLFSPYWEMAQKYPWLKNTAPAAMVQGWYGEPGIHAEISPKSSIKTGTNLVRITASSFGSDGKTSNPNMPGFYQLKYLKYQVDAINQVAGRTLIVFTYPDGIGPRDIVRR